MSLASRFLPFRIIATPARRVRDSPHLSKTKNPRLPVGPVAGAYRVSLCLAMDRGRIELPTRGFSVVIRCAVSPGPLTSIGHYTLIHKRFGQGRRGHGRHQCPVVRGTTTGQSRCATLAVEQRTEKSTDLSAQPGQVLAERAADQDPLRLLRRHPVAEE